MSWTAEPPWSRTWCIHPWFVLAILPPSVSSFCWKTGKNLWTVFWKNLGIDGETGGSYGKSGFKGSLQILQLQGHVLSLPQPPWVRPQGVVLATAETPSALLICVLKYPCVKSLISVVLTHWPQGAVTAAVQLVPQLILGGKPTESSLFHQQSLVIPRCTSL